MSYQLIKWAVQCASQFFCKKIEVKNRNLFKQKGPLVIVSNHPNSFLDAIIIGAQCKYPVHYLARGDAFKQKKFRILLRLLNMIPIYRISEGRDNLYLNEFAFKESNKVLSKGGIVLIFIEGKSINSHELLPFKKGAARIALNAAKSMQLSILPVAITYNSFTKFGKNVIIEASKPIPVNQLLPNDDEATNYLNFNSSIRPIIQKMIHWSIVEAETSSKQLNIFASLGRLLHYPLFKIVSNFVRAKTRGTVFYDSVLFGALMLIYPMYLFVIAGLVFYLSKSPLLVIGIVTTHLFLAKAAVLFQKNKQL